MFVFYSLKKAKNANIFYSTTIFEVLEWIEYPNGNIFCKESLPDVCFIPGLSLCPFFLTIG